MKIYNIKFSRYFFYMLLSLVCLAGCKKSWLDAKSDKSLVVPSTFTDFQGLLDNSDLMNQSTSLRLGEIASDLHYITDASYQALVNASIFYETDAYIWSKTNRHLSSSTFWDSTYQKVLNDNIILDGLTKIKPSSLEQSQWNDIKGQALFNRALVFFELAQAYALPYNFSTANTDLGIVMRLSSNVSIASKRSTVKETYDQILKDLNEAKEILPTRPKILTRGSSSAAYALLARVYLSMGDYENSFVAANECLKQYSALLDYNDVSISATFIGRYNVEVLFHNILSSPSITSFCLIDRDFFDKYNLNDLRKTRFYRINTNNSISFKGMYQSSTAQFSGLATDEIYLTRAECYARAGKTVEAMKDLNDLMVKRWDKSVPYPIINASDANDALMKILEERKKELILRGIRWTDLRRLNKEARFAVSLKRVILGKEHTLEPNTHKYTFPIPDNIIEQTGILQNPGWP